MHHKPLLVNLLIASAQLAVAVRLGGGGGGLVHKAGGADRGRRTIAKFERSGVQITCRHYEDRSGASGREPGSPW